MTSRPHPALPIKWLLALTALVLLVHVLLLKDSPLTLGLSQPQPLQTFTTRSIAPTPAPTAPAVAPRPPKRTPSIAKKPPVMPQSTADFYQAPPPAAKEEARDTQPTLDDAPHETLPTEATPPVAPPRDRHAQVERHYTLPGAVRLKYKVDTNKFPYSANAELRWKQDGETYDARLELSVFGQARVQTSRGQITPAGLAPIRFSDKFRSEVAAHFNREQGKVTFSANTPDAPLLAGAQDRLSILVQLAAMIAGDPAQFQPATTLALQTIGPRDADTWLFTVGEEEKLTLPGGELNALKLVRNPRQEFDQKVELWLAPALGYLPARIRITEPNGDFIDQQWLATEPPV